MRALFLSLVLAMATVGITATSALADHHHGRGYSGSAWDGGSHWRGGYWYGGSYYVYPPNYGGYYAPYYGGYYYSPAWGAYVGPGYHHRHHRQSQLARNRPTL